MKKKIISLVVIVLIIGVITSIWFLKNGDKEKKNENVNVETNSGDVSIENPDFELAIIEDLDIEKLKLYGLPIIIDFGADYCMPCKQMEPEFEAAHEATKGKAILKYVDIEKYPEITSAYPVELIPTQMLINSDGTPYLPSGDSNLELYLYTDQTEEHVLTMHVGGLTKEEMIALLKEMGMDE